MFCVPGELLLHKFQAATVLRAEARDDVLRSLDDLCPDEDRLYGAKLEYGEALVAWVTHRSCCIDCRAASFSHDLDQFASV